MTKASQVSDPGRALVDGAVIDLPAIPAGVRVVTLENGLSIIIREDHSAPVVSVQAWCKAGSINEGRWLGAGLSHVLEHMLFKGTSTRPGSRIDQEVQEAGGYMNAYTSFDRTVYWINVPNTGAKIAIDILCDIMQNAALPAEELEKEKQVILREMDMNQDDPGQRSARRLFETAYTRSPYRFTIIGYPDIYNQVTREDVYTYYKEKYVANNVFFTAVGDFNAQHVEDQIRAAYSNAKLHALPPSVLPEEPKQIAPREVIEEAPIELAHFHYSWHIPDLRHPDIPLLDVLATVLGNGRSCRLFQEVRDRRGLVSSIDAWTYTPGSPGLFGISGVTDAAKFPMAQTAILAEVERIRTMPISPAELSKAVKQFTAATLSNRKTMQGQAQDLGFGWMAANDLNFSARYLEAVKRTTPDDLQRVAYEYFTPENRTTYALVPQGAAPRTVYTVEEAVDNAIEKHVLPNGLVVLLKEDHRLPFVEMRTALKGGVLAESLENNGASLLMAKLLLKGTRTRNADEIAREIESLGGHIDTFGGNNSFGVTAEVLSTDFEVGLEMVADVLLEPTFPADHVEREREIQLAQIRAQKDDLLSTAFRMMRRSMFGDRGYGLSAQGTEYTISALTIDTIHRFHQRLTRPNNCVLAIFGDIRSDEALASVHKYFGAWPRGGERLVHESPAPMINGPKHVLEPRDKKQAVMALGFPGLAMHDQERYALELIQEACSDLGSLMFMRIRDNLGLAYYVGAQNFLGLGTGYFAFYVGTEPSKVALVEEEMLKETELLRTSGLTPEELARAKAKVIGQKKIARQDLGHLAMTTALDELYGIGHQHIDREDALYEAVTLDQTRAPAQRSLNPNAVVIATVRPE
ncbi:MAG TPA: pitrilysin family protein [Candidatus Binatia bacterium]|nr:pitrilysin family protein [Candidatus Binatia bacterium]